jgi:uncharacterized protein
MTTERKLELNGIPVVVVEPVGTPSRLVLWQTHLGGSATRLLPHLHRLAEQGCRAVSFDPPEHGARAAAGDARAFAAYVLECFRLRMWPILGIATLDALRVLDATADSSITTIAAGGISMGGDIAIALAGIDDRISRVAVTGSTPDWTRPGMRRIDSPDVEIDQGEANRHGQWLRDHLDPMLHLDRFRMASRSRCIAVARITMYPKPTRTASGPRLAAMAKRSPSPATQGLTTSGSAQMTRSSRHVSLT